MRSDYTLNPHHPKRSFGGAGLAPENAELSAAEASSKRRGALWILLALYVLIFENLSGIIFI